MYLFSGCATVTFLKENELGISMRFGDRVLRNITLSGNSILYVKKNFIIFFAVILNHLVSKLIL